MHYPIGIIHFDPPEHSGLLSWARALRNGSQSAIHERRGGKDFQQCPIIIMIMQVTTCMFLNQIVPVCLPGSMRKQELGPSLYY